METSNITKRRINEYLAQDKRFDNRKLLEYRKIEAETNVINNAEGTCRLKMGDTEVIAGVKIEIVEPYTDHEDEGTLITTVELLPLSSPDFELGPPRIEAIEIARIVDRGVRESGFIDFKKLSLKKGEKVFGILLDIYSLNHDGNLIDACALAASLALKTARMPKYDEKTETIKFGEFTNKGLPLTKKMPLTMTFYKIGDKIILDPVKEEENSAEARMSLALTNDKKILINAIQKGEEKTFSIHEVEKIIDTAIEKFKELEKELKIE